MSSPDTREPQERISDLQLELADALSDLADARATIARVECHLEETRERINVLVRAGVKARDILADF